MCRRRVVVTDQSIGRDGAQSRLEIRIDAAEQANSAPTTIEVALIRHLQRSPEQRDMRCRACPGCSQLSRVWFHVLLMVRPSTMNRYPSLTRHAFLIL